MDNEEEYIIRLRDLFSGGLKNAGRNLERFNMGIRKSHSLIDKFSMGLGKYLGPTAIAVGVGIAAKKIFDFSSAMEQTKVGYGVLIGNTETALDLVGKLNDYANVTPFQNDNLIDAGQVLLNFNTQAKDVIPTLAMLGDVSMGNRDKLRGMTLAFAQMQSTGRLMGQDLMQMINAGFNPLQEIYRKTGVDVGILKKKMEQGAISAELVKNAFISATSEGGSYFEMMKKQSETAAGKWSTFMGKFMFMLTEAGEDSLPMVKETLDGLIDTLDTLTMVDFSPVKDSFMAVYDTGKEVWGLFEDLFYMVTGTTNKVDGFQRAFNFLAIGIRAGLLPIKAAILAIDGVVRVVKMAIEMANTAGAVMSRIGKGDFSAIGRGAEKMKSIYNENMGGYGDKWAELMREEQAAANKAWNTASKGGEKGAQAETERFKLGADAFNLDKSAAATGAKSSKLDGEVRSGGVKNITINITKLVESINFSSMKENQTDLVEKIKMALLTAVNDANLAIQ